MWGLCLCRRCGALNVSVKPRSDRHGLALRLLHWLTMAILLIQFTLAGLNAWLYEARPVLAEALVQAHISWGAVLLAVTVIRIAIRRHCYRASSKELSWSKAAKAVHLLLYLCLILLPVSGYVRLATLGFPIELFGGVPLPTMSPKPELALRAAAAHNVIASFLTCAILMHVAGASLHNRLNGERTLYRMGFGKGV